MTETLPSGTLTFLFTDVEGSTRLWEEGAAPMRAAMSQHDAIVELLVGEHGGQVVRPRGEGDSRFAVFARATDAAFTAVAIQRALANERWPTPRPIRVRMALHTGEADLRDGDYYGSAVNRCARLRAIAHGGQTLLSAATRVLIAEEASRDLGLRDLGEHRLKDLQRAEHVFQVAGAGSVETFPPLHSLEAVPNNLPLQLTSFIGREDACAEVGRLVSTTRLLTLTGAGGTGKTRLALQVGAEVLESYPDGVWFIDLAPVVDPEMVAQVMLASMGAPHSGDQSAQATLVHFLQRRQALILLDNCEHLIAATATTADSILRGCPAVRILATSREALGIAGEGSWRVPPLPLPDESELAVLDPADILLRYEAIRLFVERARTVSPSFEVPPNKVRALVRLCRRLDGIPLAIELAAVRMRSMSLEQLIERLDDRFRLLTGGSRTALPRQQTLRALIEWSHSLLLDEERVLWRRLSVFAGSFTLEATESICGHDGVDVFDGLVSLVEKSVLQFEERDGETWYRLLETIRQYGQERMIEANESAELRDRHLDWYTRMAERAEKELRGYRSRYWMIRLEREHDNIRLALDWAREQGDADRARRLAGSLWHFWEVAGHYAEAARQYESILAMPFDETPTFAAFLIHFGYDIVSRQLGRRARAAAERQAWQDICQQANVPAMRSISDWVLGNHLISEGRFDESLVLLDASLQRAEAIGNRWAIFMALSRRAMARIAIDDLDGAESDIRRASSIADELDNLWFQQRVRGNRALLACRHRNTSDAIRFFEEARGLSVRLRSPRSVANHLHSMADVYLARNELGEARICALDAIRRYNDLSNHSPLMQAIRLWAAIRVAEGAASHGIRLATAINRHRLDAGMTGLLPIMGDTGAETAWLDRGAALLSPTDLAEAHRLGEAMSFDQALEEALGG